MNEAGPFEAVRTFVEVVEGSAANARTAADLGDDNPLSIIGQRRAPDAGLLREARAEDPPLAARVDAIVEHAWIREAAARTALAKCEVIVANRAVSLAEGLEGAAAVGPAERAAYSKAVDDAVHESSAWLEAFVCRAPTKSREAFSKSTGGILLFDAAATEDGPVEEALPDWRALADLVDALGNAVADLPVHVARRGASVADFRVEEPAAGGGWRVPDDVFAKLRLERLTKALPWRGAAVPLGRPGARVFATGPADRTVAAVVAGAPSWILGVARVLAALPSGRVSEFVRDPPPRPVEAGRALALALASAVLDDLLASHAAGDAETLEALAHVAYPRGTEVNGPRAALFARRYAMARLTAEAGLYDFGGGAWTAAALSGVRVSTELRAMFDEDWYRNPRAAERIAGVAAGIESGSVGEFVEFVREATSL